MRSRFYFPLGKAYGESFCNRYEESKKLIGNIQSGKHTFLVAPRRYGKSSLCEVAFERCKLPWAKIDFHISTTERDVERQIIKGVTELIGKAISNVDKMTVSIKNILKNLKPKFNISAGPFKLELEASNDSMPAENVVEALLLLENLLREKNVQAVILFDEFQEVGNLAKGRGVEGAIRHAAQETRNLSIVFSGSNPHLLRNMFENERRPLYKLCKKLTLKRIDKAHYDKHINKVAELRWGKKLDDSVFQLILSLTESHPYYINYLCDEVWSEFDELPTEENIYLSWLRVVEAEKSDLIKDFLTLSENQRRVLIHIANFGGVHVQSHKSSIKMGVPVASIPGSLHALIARDFIEKSEGVYSLVVPVYRQLLAIEND